MERDFKGIWIPAEIWLDERLTAIEKILLAEVDSFTTRDMSFFKSNGTLQKELGCSQATLSRAFQKLQSLQLVERTKFDGRIREFRSLTTRQYDKAEGQHAKRRLVNDKKQASHKDKADLSILQHSNTKKNTVKNTFKDIVLPWDTSEFKNAWDEWKSYKREQHKFTFRSDRTELASVHNLQKLANGNEQQAIAIIGQSIAQGWKGFFALKTQPRNTEQDRSKLEEYIKSGIIQSD